MRIWLSADTTASIKVKPATGLKVRDLGDGTAFTLPVSSSITQWSIDPYSTNRTRISYFHSGLQRWINWARRRPVGPARDGPFGPAGDVPGVSGRQWKPSAARCGRQTGPGPTWTR